MQIWIFVKDVVFWRKFNQVTFVLKQYINPAPTY